MADAFKKLISGKIIYFFVTIILLSAGWFGRELYASRINNSIDSPHRLKGYEYISPLISCDIHENMPNAIFRPIENAVQSTIAARETAGDVLHVGVYFRDLNSSRWVGVNENDLFWPASLMKVPTLIGVLKAVQKDPSVLQKKFQYSDVKDENEGEHFKAAQTLSVGHSYAVDEMLSYMIQYSDNDATVQLAKIFGQQELLDVYADANIPFPQNNEVKDYMSPKSISYFFRLLYNASYVNREYSQSALQLLTTTDFTEGLRAGVPDSVPVAHKFGEQTIGDERELHDCGIVYLRDHPYSICLMTKGKDFDRQVATIADISRVVYSEAEKILK
ncbi:MAG: class A beta-lactamase-related serine hydrolase [Candidatus Magasanikbacteria bacterium]|nr:class A beta-lactamase-related serine hydrolase [Candidatus Magasanikbacteria bacterium]